MLKDDDVIINVVSHASQRRTSKAELKKQKFAERFLKRNERSASTSRNNRPTKSTSPAKANIAPVTASEEPVVEKQSKPKQAHQPKQKRYYNEEQEMGPSDYVSRQQIIEAPAPLELLPIQPKKPSKKNIHSIDQIDLHKSLHSSLSEAGLHELTEIQKLCLQPIRNGSNVVMKAQAGSGKTLSYLIPLIDGLLKSGRVKSRESGTFVIVICPTRELCLQSEKQAWKCLKRSAFMIPGSLMGGESAKKEKARLRKGVTIVFSTPGRLEYHIQNTQSFDYTNLSCLVFDEADKTLDMGYRKELNNIFTIMREKLSDFELVQKVLVSAQFNDKIEDLIQNLSPQNLQYLGFSGKTSEEPSKFDKEINISSQLRQTFVLLAEQQRVPFLLAYLNVLSHCQILIFLSTIDEVEWFEYMLSTLEFRDSNGTYTGDKLERRQLFKLHGNIDQKIRSQTYFAFRKSNNSILLSTEVASRGLDFPELSHIVLFDQPPTMTDYANRIGRTARMNSNGVSLLILNYQESAYVEQLKVYTPEIEAIDKDVAFNAFSNILRKMNIRTECMYYLQGLIRALVRDDPEKYALARRAYVSMLRAYARLPNKEIFKVKQLNLKDLAKNFGLNSVKSKDQNPKNRRQIAQKQHETSRKKRKVEDIRQLQVSQYL